MRTLITTLVFVCISAVAIAETAGPFGENVYLAKYKKMTLRQLRSEMANDVPTRRGFVGEAIAQHGIKAWPIIKDAMADSDWRARSSALYTLEKLFPNTKDRKEKAQQEELRKSLSGLIPVLTKALSDDHYWVRCSAAGMLSKMGKAAKPAASELARICGDKNVWVRGSAIEALSNIPNAPLETSVQGVINVLNNKRTSFADSRFAMMIIRKHSKDIKNTKEFENALFHFVENPGEGMWSDNLSKTLEMLVDFKADEKRLAKLYNKVLTEPLYEQRGAQRTVVANAILKMDNAVQFAPALKKAIEREKYLIAGGFSKTKDQLKLLEQALKHAQ